MAEICDFAEMLEPNFQDGSLTWKRVSKYHSEKSGGPAGGAQRGRRGKKYWVVRIGGKAYRRSWLIYALAFGRWPENCLDHINGNSLDDRLVNLRDATVMENSWNRKTRAKQNDLPMGVRPLPSGRFNARITCRRAHHILGVYDTAAEAAEAYQAKRKELFGEFA